MSNNKYHFVANPSNSIVPLLILMPGKEGIIQNVGLYRDKEIPFDVFYTHPPGSPSGNIHVVNLFSVSSRIGTLANILEMLEQDRIPDLARLISPIQGHHTQLILELAELRELEKRTAQTNPAYRKIPNT